MSEDDKPSSEPVHRATTKNHRDARAEALQKALRENLRRRKAATVEEKPAPAESSETRTDET